MGLSRRMKQRRSYDLREDDEDAAELVFRTQALRAGLAFN